MGIPLPAIGVVFVSFDEPNCEAHWRDLRRKCPWAVRLHGVKGQRKAFCKAAGLVDTRHVLIVEGDNVVDEAFFDGDLESALLGEAHVLVWPGRNAVNGLAYENGGMKCWPRLRLLRHGPGDIVSWQDRIDLSEAPSIACINGSPYQAFRAGFREAVRLCRGRGRRIERDGLEERIGRVNHQRLLVWGSVGADVEHGLWAVYGARLGIRMAADGTSEDRLIDDYDWLCNLWRSVLEDSLALDAATIREPERVDRGVLIEHIRKIGDSVAKRLGVRFGNFGADESRFFKDVQFGSPALEHGVALPGEMTAGQFSKMQQRQQTLESLLSEARLNAEGQRSEFAKLNMQRDQLTGARIELRRQLADLTDRALSTNVTPPARRERQTGGPWRYGMGLWQRVRSRLARTEQPEPESPRPNRPDAITKVRKRPVVAVLIFEASEIDLVKFLDQAVRSAERWDVTPVVVTDSDHFHLLRERQLPVEYIPPDYDKRTYGPELDWPLYVRRRFQLIMRKWSPREVVPYGPSSMPLARIWADIA